MLPLLGNLTSQDTHDHDDTCSSSDDEYDDNENNDDDDDDLVVVDDDFVYQTSNINCLNGHLKVSRIENYSGRQAHLDFGNLVVAKARVLEAVTLVYGNDYEDKWIEAQKQYLIQNAASNMSRVEFVKERGI